MAARWPQLDKPAGLSGGADSWDSSAGALLLADYFDPAPPASSDYPLTCQGGTYATAGGSSQALKGRRITATAGGYTVTGVAAVISRHRMLGAASGIYTTAGAAGILLKTKRLLADGGVYAQTGTLASLTRGCFLAVQGGGYTINGQSILLSKSGPAWPDEADVRTGVRYGPTGAEYTGTMSSNGGGGNAILMRRR